MKCSWPCGGTGSRTRRCASAPDSISERGPHAHQIDRQREGLSPGVKVLMGVGIGAAAILGGLLIFLATVYD
jgi:hypothetical protein